MLVAGGEDEVVVVEAVDFQADVGEGPEAEGLFDEDGVGRYAVLWEALDVEAVAAVLEIAIDLGLVEVLDPDDGPWETDVLRVGAGQSPLSEEVAGFAALLTRS